MKMVSAELFCLLEKYQQYACSRMGQIFTLPIKRRHEVSSGNISSRQDQLLQKLAKPYLSALQ
ncbi:MAG TPA: hypothetical protein VN030_03885 [Cellvibrio sp.]|nr:hypothetical protein [Cellvibrio sp.]